jgi:hypothetical protein
MRKERPMTPTWRQGLAALLAAACLAGSCEESDDGGGAGKTDCEKADEIIAAAGQDYCGPRKDECCYCRCFLEDKVIDTSVTDGCACKILEGDGTGDTDDDTCEGFRLNEAQACLEDEDACEEDYLKTIVAGCLMSPLD